jgi:hypothetical protein
VDWPLTRKAELPQRGISAEFAEDFAEALAEFRASYRVRRVSANEWQVVHAEAGFVLATCPTRGEALRRADEFAADDLADDWAEPNPDAEEYKARAAGRDD